MSLALFDLSGKTALVTGSSRGLGLAIARGLGAAGARVIVNGVDTGNVDAAVQTLSAAGVEVIPAPFDVTDREAVADAFARFDAQGIDIDILVNNAGVVRRAPMVDVTPEEWSWIIDVNLTAPFLIGRLAAERMMARGKGGKIINMGSLTSGLARPTVGPYAVTKAGIAMLTRAMAAEWAQHGLQINAIGPGYMQTDLNRPLMEDAAFSAWVGARTPARRWGRPDELVGASIFLASEASSFVNGQIIYVDGGITATV
ncbi:SDR family oxidoreductase [Bosea sp. 117]|uniref:SDR family oxidoreductase n=1 Tax=Bosea sp. 117 TaxID=1125973 RepID=UPI0004943BFB|nr:SDR family oxidoreductase [Bosea sp. 117]